MAIGFAGLIEAVYHQPTEFLAMTSQIKNAVITTATVLAVIYALNMFAPSKAIVQKALGA